MWALVVDTLVYEVTDLDPLGRFHPSLQWYPCDNEVEVGWRYMEGAFSPPEPSQASDHG